uniref:HD2 n=1 Tax=Volvariella volvacea TaxID=36659 RepID=K9KA03_9AGAR|nr:HD2 [Volvariella volvacea]AOC97535.1 HD2 protein [Volvariella volvacea]
MDRSRRLLQGIHALATGLKTEIGKRSPTDIVQEPPRPAPLVPLHLPFPTDILDLIRHSSLSEHKRNELIAAAIEYIKSSQADLTSNYNQACSGLAAWPIPGVEPTKTTLEFRSAFEKKYNDHLIPHLRKRVDYILTSIISSHDRKRKAFNHHYSHLLERYFEQNAYPSAADRRHLAQKTVMSPRQIEVWFQNHRSRARKEGKILKRPYQSSDLLRQSRACEDTVNGVNVQSNLVGDAPPSVPSPNPLDNSLSTPSHAFPSRYHPSTNPDCSRKFDLPWNRLHVSLDRRSPASRVDSLDSDSLEELITNFATLRICDFSDRPKFRSRSQHKAIHPYPFYGNLLCAPHPSLLNPRAELSVRCRSPLPTVRAPAASNYIFSKYLPSPANISLKRHLATALAPSQSQRIDTSSSFASAPMNFYSYHDGPTLLPIGRVIIALS